MGIGFKALVCGGRTYKDKASLFRHMDRLRKLHEITMVIHGDAPGADSLVDEWALSRKIAVVRVPAQWDNYSRKAGVMRNSWMLRLDPHMCIAFTGYRGTEDMVLRCRNAAIPVIDLRKGERKGPL